jgi:hypothetical protein
MKPLYVVLFTVTTLTSPAQKVTISGSVKASNSGEHLIGACIFNAGTAQGTTANSYGFYSFTLPGDSVLLRVSYVGHEPVTTKFFLTKDTVINVGLNEGTQLQEVVITGTPDK